MKPKMAYLWCFVSLVLGTLLAVQWNHSRKQQTKLETLQLQVEKLSQQARSSESQLELHEAERREEHERTLAQATVKGVEPVGIATQAEMPSRTGRNVNLQPPLREQSQGGSRFGNVISDMLKNPEMRQAFEQQQRMGLNLAYHPLFEQLELSSEQEQKFKEILLEQQMSNLSQAGTLMEGGTNTVAVTQSMGDQVKQRQDQIKEVLGEEKFAHYQDYNQTIGERMILNQFGREMEMSSAQKEQLFGIIREEKKNVQINVAGQGPSADNGIESIVGTPEAVEHVIAQQERVNARVLEKAGQVLSVEQVRKLEPILKTQLEMQSAGIKMARQMFGGEAKETKE